MGTEYLPASRAMKPTRPEVGCAPCGPTTTPTSGNFPPEDPPEGFDYDLWLGPAPWAPYCENRTHYQFRWILDYSGGQVTDWGAHHIDIAQRLHLRST